MGPFSSPISNAAITVAGKHKIPMVLVCANDRVLFEKPNYWRVTQLRPAEWEYKNLVPLYKKKGGVKTFATLTMDTLHNKGATNGFQERLGQSGFKVVYSGIAPPPTKNFAPMITKIKNANPDVVAIEALSVAFTIGFLKQMREAGFKPKEVLVGHVTKHVLKALGPDAENITGLAYFPPGNTQDHKDFYEITKRAGFTWGEFMESAIRYWAYKTIQSAIEQAGRSEKDHGYPVGYGYPDHGGKDETWAYRLRHLGAGSLPGPGGQICPRLAPGLCRAQTISLQWK
jgi:ABC-type branched-subunit amino acid transport system substrate-binding protein